MPKLTQSYVRGADDEPLISDTIGNYFDSTAKRQSERLALVVRHQGVRWTYAELKQRVDDFAAGLLALGLDPGDRIGIWSPNNAEWTITQYATAKAGLIQVNLNTAYRATELVYAVNAADRSEDNIRRVPIFGKCTEKSSYQYIFFDREFS